MTTQRKSRFIDDSDAKSIAALSAQELSTLLGPAMREIEIAEERRITQAQYDKLSTQFRAKQQEATQKLEQLQEVDEQYYIDAITVLNVASRSKELFIGSDIESKRQILKLVLLNLSFDGRNVQYSLQKPFDSIFHASNRSAWGG